MPCSEMCDVLSYPNIFFFFTAYKFITLRFSVKYLVYTCMQVIFTFDDYLFLFICALAGGLCCACLMHLPQRHFAAAITFSFMSYLTTFSFLSIILFHFRPEYDSSSIKHLFIQFLLHIYLYYCNGTAFFSFNRPYGFDVIMGRNFWRRVHQAACFLPLFGD